MGTQESRQEAIETPEEMTPRDRRAFSSNGLQELSPDGGTRVELRGGPAVGVGPEAHGVVDQKVDRRSLAARPDSVPSDTVTVGSDVGLLPPHKAETRILTRYRGLVGGLRPRIDGDRSRQHRPPIRRRIASARPRAMTRASTGCRRSHVDRLPTSIGSPR